MGTIKFAPQIQAIILKTARAFLIKSTSMYDTDPWLILFLTGSQSEREETAAIP